MDFNVYKDIEKRTNGEIYIGVVGPVRTGKSTFIKNFMDIAVVPNIKDENEVRRTMDELPQSSAGKTIMTTEPKFIPNKAVNIKLGEKANIKVRLIDCVGFMVNGATGHMEEDKERMVKTPWFDYDIPFSKAAEIGTEKVISEHSTIGIVITSDGSFTDLDVEEYNKALDKTINELKNINKPFIILVNSINPDSMECKMLRDQIAENILFEFPISEIIFNVPKWLEIIGTEHKLMKYIIEYSQRILESLIKIKDIKTLNLNPDKEYVKNVQMTAIELSTGRLILNYDIDESYYYETLSEMAGTKIENQLQLIKMVKELSMEKNTYIKVNEAINKVKTTGYGIANILTEISPIIGSEEQARDLIGFINEKEQDSNVWETNIFGKTIGEIVDEGIINKINNLTAETQSRMQGTIEKITNDQSRGVICIVL